MLVWCLLVVVVFVGGGGADYVGVGGGVVVWVLSSPQNGMVMW